MGLLAEWKMWREPQVWEVPGHPGGILGEATSRHLEKGPENSGERSGLKRQPLEAPRKRRPAFLGTSGGQLSMTCLWAGCDLQTAEVRLFSSFLKCILVANICSLEDCTVQSNAWLPLNGNLGPSPARTGFWLTPRISAVLPELSHTPSIS